MMVPVAGDGEVTITVPPLNVSPLRVGPVAEPAEPAEAWTTGGVAALAWATGAAIARAVMAAVARAASLRIELGGRCLGCLGMGSPEVEMFLAGCSVFMGVPYL
jgi:hypothetical protein